MRLQKISALVAHLKNNKLMFSDDELKCYDEQLNQLGITGKKEKKEVLEYFYVLGKIIYTINTRSYEKES